MRKNERTKKTQNMTANIKAHTMEATTTTSTSIEDKKKCLSLLHCCLPLVVGVLSFVHILRRCRYFCHSILKLYLLCSHLGWIFARSFKYKLQLKILLCGKVNKFGMNVCFRYFMALFFCSNFSRSFSIFRFLPLSIFLLF